MVTAATSDRRLLELLVHIAWTLRERCAKRQGLVKLNKLVYFIDRDAWLKLGHQITDIDYVRADEGPIPDRYRERFPELIGESGEALRAEKVELGFRYQSEVRMLATRPADLTIFSPDELQIIGKVLDEHSHATGSELSQLSHRDYGWRSTTNGDPIHVGTSAVVHPDDFTDADRAFVATAEERFERQ